MRFLAALLLICVLLFIPRHGTTNNYPQFLMVVPQTNFEWAFDFEDQSLVCDCCPSLYQGGIIEYSGELNKALPLNSMVQIIGPELRLVLECAFIGEHELFDMDNIETQGDILIIDDNFIYFLVRL